MEPPKDYESLKRFTLSAYRELAGNRAYALDATSTEALTALAKSYFNASDNGVGTKEEFGKVLQELGEYVPGLFQPKPEEPAKLPEWPRHPLTNELMPNPWSPDHKNLDAQSKIMARDPDLGRAMQAAVKDSWSYFFDLKDSQTKREHRAAISYTEDDHKMNPYVSGGLKQQSELAKRDPIRLEVFKREAEPVRLPFHPRTENITLRGQLFNRSPRLYQWGENARTTCQKWHDERVTALKAAEQQARQDREALEHQLKQVAAA